MPPHSAGAAHMHCAVVSTKAPTVLCVCHVVLCHCVCAVHWIFKNKDHGKTSATASLGLISLWDVEGGLPLIDK